MFDYKIARRQRFDVQHSTDLRDVHRGAGVPVAEEKGRIGSNGEDQYRQGEAVYDLLDTTDFYHPPGGQGGPLADERPFTLHDDALDEAFLKQAKSRGLIQLKGHRSVGGMRASIYNAMPLEGVAALVEFMREFASNHA